jgi:hypothetical protein
MVNNLVGTRINENFKFLKKLCRCRSDKSRWRLLKGASEEELLSIVEICSNLIRPHCFYLRQRQKSLLQPYANHVRKLSRIRTEAGARRYTVQHGTGPFFAALLTPIIAEASRHILTNLVSSPTLEKDG